MSIRKFNSVAGFSVGENDIVVVNENSDVTAANLTVNGDAVIDGNLTVSGTFTYVESSVTYVTDPVVEQGGGANGTILTTNDNKDRGTLLHYYDTSAKSAFIGYDNSSNVLVLATDVSITDNVVTVNNLGNVIVGNIDTKAISANGDVTINGLLTVNGGQINTVNAGALTTGKIVSQPSNVEVQVNTVIDAFDMTEFRSVKYTIKSGSDLGFQTIEVLLVHDNDDAFITVYGSVSTINDDIVVLDAVINNGNVNLIASGIAANTFVNLIGIYVTD